MIRDACPPSPRHQRVPLDRVRSGTVRPVIRLLLPLN